MAPKLSPNSLDLILYNMQVNKVNRAPHFVLNWSLDPEVKRKHKTFSFIVFSNWQLHTELLVSAEISFNKASNLSSQTVNNFLRILFLSWIQRHPRHTALRCFALMNVLPCLRQQHFIQSVYFLVSSLTLSPVIYSDYCVKSSQGHRLIVIWQKELKPNS